MGQFTDGSRCPDSGWAAKIAHATLKIGDTAIPGSDVPPDRYEQPRGFQVVLQMDDAVAAERLFHALAEEGKIAMPLQETFWAIRFGLCWSIGSEYPGQSIVKKLSSRHRTYYSTAPRSRSRVTVLL